MKTTRFGFRSASLLALVVLVTASCASTKLTSSWREPTAGPLKFAKVIVIVIATDETIRRTAEDQLVGMVKKTTAVASYTLISANDLQDKEAARAHVTAGGFDGALVMRVAGKEDRERWVAGSYPTSYYSFYGYYGYAGAMVYSPSYLVTDTIVNVETNVYSVKDDKLIWSGLSETFNPKSTQALIGDVARAVAWDLKKQGLIE